ncbi:DUF6716 putative glycosyltransferase [Marisediminicola senii]|uniref:DUF6716 putative glycosyltransferase n=1 Tax=Marisediminicola senii TaxID=2711233 RepID=UPI0013EE2F2F|nr:DUF6716 putative glycosyltransferase [Marisediminicola senii]
MRVLALTDSDSYLKWGAAVLERAPESWNAQLVVLANPAAPSAAQTATALAGTRFAAALPPVVDLAGVADLIADGDTPFDVVLLSVRGPVVRVLVRSIVEAATLAGRRRPVLVGGLPGISIPATRKALYYRAQVDLMLLHSVREIREFTWLAAQMGMEQQFALGTLPFLPRERTVTAPGRDIVFAAQAKVPRSKEDRQLVLSWLAQAARGHPRRRVVIKIRAVVGEQQTHAEKYPYTDLLAEMPNVPPNLVVASGPMLRHLDQAAALVTVSSTAAIEAAAMGLPVLVLDDFGVSDDLINPVFEGSGLFGSSRALITGDFARVRESWLADNYLHDECTDDWVERIDALVTAHAASPIPLRAQHRGSLGGNLRRIWDRKRALGSYDTSLSGHLAIAVGTPARWVVLALRYPRRLANRRRAERVHRPATAPSMSRR